MIARGPVAAKRPCETESLLFAVDLLLGTDEAVAQGF
jgi:hypothetical protein